MKSILFLITLCLATSALAYEVVPSKNLIENILELISNLLWDIIYGVADVVYYVGKIIEFFKNHFGKRDLVQTWIDRLGLGDVWQTIQQLGANTVLQFTQIFTQLLFAGQNVISEAKKILAQLVEDLKNHASDAVPLVAAAINSLQQTIQGAGKRR